ncbi:MAG: SET domain-containing protein-lysine N-methyltransferase [Bacteroidota bacterium]
MDSQPEIIEAKEASYLYTQVSTIQQAGNGLFTAMPIYKNEVIAIFKGKILSNQQARQLAEAKLDGYFINMVNGSIMDSRNTKCFAKYANDALSKNKNNAQITLDSNNKVCLQALRDIASGEEIFCSYGKKYWAHFDSK